MAVVPGTHTFTDGIATSSEANAYVRDPINFLLARPIARLRQATLQTVGTGAYTAITFDAEDVDINPAGTPQHDLVTNNTRFTAVYPGWYSLGGGVGWATNATNRRGCRYAVNGTLVPGSAVVSAATSLASCEVAARKDLVYLNVGDYVELQGFQDTGGNLNTTVSSTETEPTLVVNWMSI